MDKILLTNKGLIELKKELKELNERKLPEIIERIKIARGYGDLSENSEYQEAKNEQVFIEGRIGEINSILKNYGLIEDEKVKGKISIGSTISVETFTNGVNKGVETFSIVGTTEVDIRKGKISNESELGKNMIGKKKGESFSYKINGQEYSYVIKEVK